MEHLAELLERVLHPGRIRLSALPALDLYMDQIISLLEGGYASNRRNPEEKLLTKTMINNYRKEGLIGPIKGKKYTREHLVQMLSIYELKNTLTLGEIRQVFSRLYAQENFDGAQLGECYERSLDLAEQQSAALGALLDAAVTASGAKSGDPRDLFVALSAIASMSQLLQTAAERMVDAYFPPPESVKPTKRGDRRAAPPHKNV
ncbi:MAG: DUF1836 domain-containing protein [Oscillospiraceae bacterium]